MLADTDAGNVVTAAQSGAQWGYHLLPLILILTPLLYMLQELTAAGSNPMEPTSSSWLNLVERFFGELTADVVREGSFQSARELVRAIESYPETNYLKAFTPTNLLRNESRLLGLETAPTVCT